MGKNRLEAFSDGVLAIIITIMVLELKAPHGDTVAVLIPLVPSLLTYVLSFVYLGIYWNNHHHMLHACHTVTGSILWANLHLLFWLSLIPFTTGWMGENHFATSPAAAYGVVLLMAAIAYWILQHRIIASQGEDSILKRAIGSTVCCRDCSSICVAVARRFNICPGSHHVGHSRSAYRACAHRQGHITCTWSTWGSAGVAITRGGTAEKGVPSRGPLSRLCSTPP